MSKILGIGIDIVSVERIEAALERQGQSFIQKLFTLLEIEEMKRRKMCPEHIAGRFALKEAVAKSLGTGFGKKLQWRSIESSNDSTGKPSVTISGLSEFAGRVPKKSFLISISHEKQFAVASAVLLKHGYWERVLNINRHSILRNIFSK